MTPRQEALAFIARYGAELIDNSGPGQLIGRVARPAGKQWFATGCHTISMNFRTDRPAGWVALRDDLRQGLDDCDDPDCEVCE